MMEGFISTFHSRTFMTSLEVIKEVMNVPMAAVHAIARMNGISTADNHKKIISEEKLLPFVEAFERKTRNYFVNSMRNYAQLKHEEMQTFTEFCMTFKKGNVSLAKVSNWSHIGKTKLRQYFVDQIKEKTPSSSTLHTKLDLFAGCGGFEILSEGDFNSVDIDFSIDDEIERILALRFCHREESEYINIISYRQPSDNLINRFTSTWHYRARIKSNRHYRCVISDRVNEVFRSARYYIYVDDDEDHLYDTVSVNGHDDLFINSTLKMVA